MEAILLVLILVVLLVRSLYLRQKFQEIERKFEELQAAVRRIEWARAHEQRPPAAPAPSPAPAESKPSAPEPRLTPVVPAPSRPSVAEPVVVPAASDFLEPAVVRRQETPPPAPPAPPAPAIDWEMLIGGNLFLKAGTLIAVIAMAYLLQYAWVRVGPVG